MNINRKNHGTYQADVDFNAKLRQKGTFSAEKNRTKKNFKLNLKCTKNQRTLRRIERTIFYVRCTKRRRHKKNHMNVEWFACTRCDNMNGVHLQMVKIYVL